MHNKNGQQATGPRRLGHMVQSGKHVGSTYILDLIFGNLWLFALKGMRRVPELRPSAQERDLKVAHPKTRSSRSVSSAKRGLVLSWQAGGGLQCPVSKRGRAQSMGRSSWKCLLTSSN